MRKTSLALVHDFAKRDERVVFIGSDLGVNTLDAFRREMPSRFFMEGVSEANIIGMAAGLAAEGHIVYVNTLAVFLTRRAYEQVALDVCLHNLDVRLIGNGGGLVYGPLGPTHTATDDIGLMRLLPNMAIAAPADAREMEQCMRLLETHRGPAYIRLGKGGDPIAGMPDAPEALGKAVPVRDGADVLIVSTGIAIQMARSAAEILAAAGVEARMVHFPWVKPLDVPALRQAAAGVRVIAVVEEHIATGGLASAVTETLMDDKSTARIPLVKVTLPDVFPDRYGRQEELLDGYGVTGESLARKIRDALSLSR